MEPPGAPAGPEESRGRFRSVLCTAAAHVIENETFADACRLALGSNASE